MTTDHLNKDYLLGLAESILALSEADQTEVVLMTGEDYLTRFSKNHIHQNVGSRHASVTIRAVTGKQIGVAQAESLDEASLRDTLAKAQEIAGLCPPVEDFKGLPKPGRIRPIEAFDEATARTSPEERARIVVELVTAAKRRRGEAAGLVQTQAGAMAVANSRGVRAYHRMTGAQFQSVVTCGDGSGYAESQGTALGDLDVRGVIRDGVGKAARSRKPQPIEAGDYDVVLEPAAVGSLVDMLGYSGFGAKAFQEGRSFMSGKIGQKVTGDAITIVDNAHDARQKGLPFDFEGVPRKRVKLIDRGVAAGVVYDSYLAGREAGRRASTGHALPPKYASYGAMPMNLLVSGGDQSLRSLIAGTERGLLVTRFHYVNFVEPVRAVLTGMTRDGTFWIENGKIAHPVRNLRFTESVIAAFERCDGLSRMRRRVEGGAVCPAMRIRGFRFSGKTEF
ncbi:MAG TPA: TldD/PmbA family protein [Phycisphaerae bacterium]|nr:TldD/PmbA family protein [Phycisphaerae bacterium]HOI55227.1 TldD/PmbA family protein [Phycisphaerae bacterium]